MQPASVVVESVQACAQIPDSEAYEATNNDQAGQCPGLVENLPIMKNPRYPFVLIEAPRGCVAVPQVKHG